METEYKVYPDRLKEILSLLIYFSFIAGMVCILIFYELNLFIVVMLVVFILLFGIMMSSLCKKIIHNDIRYLFNEEGITDCTRKEHIIHLTWEEIGKIEILSNNSSLQIGIVGSKVFEKKEEISMNIRENLIKNGNMIFYNIIIDGFLYRKKKFDDIFKVLQKMASQHNPSIIINEYIDPLARRKKKKSI